jgi:hypothetical protein
LKLDVLERQGIGDGAAVVGGRSFGPRIARERDPLGLVYLLGDRRPGTNLGVHQAGGAKTKRKDKTMAAEHD